jgi:hypothetical protein
MAKSRLLVSIVSVCCFLCAGAAPSRAAGCEDKIARHMVGEAMLAAQFVAAAEKNGMSADAINAALKDIAAKSAVQEFWITDSSGHAYLTNTGIDFTFSSEKAAAGLGVLAAAHRRQDGRHSERAQARDRQPDLQICRRRRRRQTGHRAGRRRRGEFVQVTGKFASPHCGEAGERSRAG